MDYKALVTTADYGSIEITLGQAIKDRGLSVNKLARLTGLDYRVVQRLAKADNLVSVDLDFLARICCVLDCDLSEIMHYKKG